MSLLLVVVFLFFSSSCSVSSNQYYVSDDCSSIIQSPCNPLSVYVLAGYMSIYHNTIYYFIGTTTIIDHVTMNVVKNVTLHGLDQSPSIHCNKEANSISLHYSDHVTISNLSFSCSLEFDSSNDITITNSTFASSGYGKLILSDTFDVKISSVIFTEYNLYIGYIPLPSCRSELLHYSLILTNVTFTTGAALFLEMNHGSTYNVSIIFNQVEYCYTNNLKFFLGGLFYFLIANSSFQDNNDISGFPIEFNLYSKSSDCTYPGTQLTSTLVIKESQVTNNSQGLKIVSKQYLLRAVNYHIIIKSCLIHDNINEGLFIDGTFMKLTQIDIIDTALIGNGGNKIMNNNATSLSNVTVANSTSTGLSLTSSLVTIKDNFIFINNTGVVGGGLAINDSSRLMVSSSANFEFIDNHASYKGGGIYAEESTHSDIKLMTPNIPLTLINNTAGLAGDDMYGIFDMADNNQFQLTNPNISSTGNPIFMCFCDPHATTTYENCINASNQCIYPGQALKFNVALLSHNYFGKNTPTDSTVQVYDNDTNFLLNQTHIPNTCSLIEYTPKLTQTGCLVSTSPLLTTTHRYAILYFTVKKCPIGFRLDKSQVSCTCSQSVSRENVTCDINSLNITHNGLLWIGAYDTSTLFNANATNPKACIINEDCLLYCSPNPVTFKLNDTHTQCVDNRGHRMCGSCTEGYSLLMGSNKCEQCHNNYTMIAWIALFAVMGILLVVLLIALNLTVSVGTLNGLLFYANIVKLYEPVFSRKGALPVLSQVISWINLDFGFEICFYNGMDSYVKQWLQFAFPLYLWIIIIIIIQLCRRYGKISRLMGSHAVPVLSTLFLLSYTKLVRTIVIVLHKREVTLHCKNESVRSVSLWYEDPNVEYAKGKHAGLFGFALLVSVFFVIPYTLFLLLNRFYEKYLSNFKVFKKFWSRFKPIIDAYSGPMKDEYRFWPGLLLVARIPVLLSVTLVDSFIQSQHFLLSMLLTVLVTVLSLGYCFGGVYKKRMNNVLEVWFLFNLCIMIILFVALNENGKLSDMKCYDALIKKFFKKQDKDDEPLLDVTESHLTVDQQKRAMVPSSTDVRRCASRESVVDLF
uniref:Right handed beta helix domain-containing protein n=1 Tax=Amphimedon queenslandica TaxID=400682 RepID=A0A1X7UNJ5_AMPQE